jgi:hypothetical protein
MGTVQVKIIQRQTRRIRRESGLKFIGKPGFSRAAATGDGNQVGTNSDEGL